eukprot:CAMPEP_0174858928 /NCGR_PEP_ID=MMETSP1114-20130205/44585_1 /TAXON_ID=312471 /ORGANISM="Neobodo designis, Strain CCAP 1951/1" /LENGTH=54 /DNA_ID=CAMNT_0016093851 /DNA_START=17 /DNA_END=178 /DNA_ORIENTATION=-
MGRVHAIKNAATWPRLIGIYILVVAVGLGVTLPVIYGNAAAHRSAHRERAERRS